MPSVGPLITSAELDPKRPREATIKWNKIEKKDLNGELVGYNLYYGVTRNGKDRTTYPTVVHKKEVISDSLLSIVKIAGTMVTGPFSLVYFFFNGICKDIIHFH